eukprot:2230555-Pleurochrysis_carterae.AAC.3
MRPSRAPDIYLRLSPRAPIYCGLTVTCSVCRFGPASHAYLRSARAPLLRLYRNSVLTMAAAAH